MTFQPDIMLIAMTGSSDTFEPRKASPGSAGGNVLRFDRRSAEQARIGQNLRLVYREVSESPMPANLQDLIDRLDSIDFDGSAGESN